MINLLNSSGEVADRRRRFELATRYRTVPVDDHARWHRAFAVATWAAISSRPLRRIGAGADAVTRRVRHRSARA